MMAPDTMRCRITLGYGAIGEGEVEDAESIIHTLPRLQFALWDLRHRDETVLVWTDPDNVNPAARYERVFAVDIVQVEILSGISVGTVLKFEECVAD